MNHISKRTSLIILGVTALLLSRAMFAFFDDPEGPNLLIVTVMAMFIYFVSLSVYKYSKSLNSLKKIILTISTQVIVVGILTFLLR